MIIACLNGDRSTRAHPRLPVTPEQLGADTADCVLAGATMVHVHPRDESGRESLRELDITEALTAIRHHAPGVRVSVSTRDGIAADFREKLALIRSWPMPIDGGPDCASVNWHEPGAVEVARLLSTKGIGVEAGIWTPRAAIAFVSTNWPWQVERVLAEAVPGVSPGVSGVWATERILTALGMSPKPVLVHGEGAWTWPVFRWGQAAGRQVRIGFEDTLLLPSGREAYDNAELVRTAGALPDEAASSWPYPGPY
ncbi:MAG: 3-keto-5-aminohexanoate cleavage protein [Micrococcales bacterium]|nr:3-keto-5-aminohexanoate cleavage protein [Micrococcales bacterium]